MTNHFAVLRNVSGGSSGLTNAIIKTRGPEIENLVYEVIVPDAGTSATAALICNLLNKDSRETDSVES